MYIRISKQDKKRIKIRTLNKNFKNLSEYVLYCVMKEISEDEVNNLLDCNYTNL